MTEITRAEQVQRQYQAIARLARALAEVHEDIAPAVTHMKPGMVEMIGKRSADIMETLGDILNGMDAVVEEDADLDPVFDMAHQMFPLDPADT